MKQILSKGFTLIELLVVFAVIGSLMLTSMAAFFTYNRSQSFKTSVADVAYVFDTAKTRAQSQVKPPQCGAQVLRGYQVSVTAPGNTYQLSVICNVTTYVLVTKTLPSNVTFVAGSTSPTIFAVSTGILSKQSTITMTGYGSTKNIIINTTGNITIP